jgi:hypothetical protein
LFPCRKARLNKKKSSRTFDLHIRNQQNATFGAQLWMLLKLRHFTK